MSFMMAFGWVSVMLLLGVFLRVKIPLLRKMLIPANVVAGILGLIFINLMSNTGINVGTDFDTYSNMVIQLFTISFISIALTSPSKEKHKNNDTAKNIVKGSLFMGLIWCFLYALTPLVSVGIIATGLLGEINPVYGMLIQFGFCQGPGQAASYGAIFEQYGWTSAATIGVSFASIGFLAAFLVGIPAIRFGIKKGLAIDSEGISEASTKEYFNAEIQSESPAKNTIPSLNIETITFHFAIIGLCYLLAILISKLFALIPGFLGTSLSGMLFICGMFAGYIVKAIMRLLHLDALLNNTLQNKITIWTTDYLVVCSFMAVSMNLIRDWVFPILVVAVTTTVITFFVCFCFCRHMGGSNDFERAIGLFGTCTGTVPTGIALVRVIDKDFKTTTSIELGGMNITMLASTPIVFLIMAFASGSVNFGIAMGGLALCSVIYLVLFLLSILILKGR